MFDLIVIGGGPAGTAAALTAARMGAHAGRILLLERGRWPRHKVCGEFVSAEAMTVLRRLLSEESSTEAQRHREDLRFTICDLRFGPPRTETQKHRARTEDGSEEGIGHALLPAQAITRARLYVDGGCAEFAIAPPAASIARYELDAALWTAAQKAGIDARQQVAVRSVERRGNIFKVSAGEKFYEARAVVDASGRSSKSQTPSSETRRHSDEEVWIGLKAHYRNSHPEDTQDAAAARNSEGGTTDLYFFPGGYCGVQPVTPASQNRACWGPRPQAGQGLLNVCAMVRSGRATRLPQVFALHPRLEFRSRHWTEATTPVATAPLVFGAAKPVRAGVLCAGDAARFIDPFVGDGISLALRSGVLAAEALSGLWREEATLEEAAAHYAREYRRCFLPAFRHAAWARHLLAAQFGQRFLLQLMRVPAVARWAIALTR